MNSDVMNLHDVDPRVKIAPIIHLRVALIFVTDNDPLNDFRS